MSTPLWQDHSAVRAAQASDGGSVYDSGEFEASNATLRLPREVVRQMRDTVFGFELRHSLLPCCVRWRAPSLLRCPKKRQSFPITPICMVQYIILQRFKLERLHRFFVTGVEDYQANGVLFKGNLRGDPARAYRHISERLQVRRPAMFWHDAQAADVMWCGIEIQDDPIRLACGSGYGSMRRAYLCEARHEPQAAHACLRDGKLCSVQLRRCMIQAHPCCFARCS